MMIDFKHAVFQDVLSHTNDGILQSHIVGIIRTVEFANLSMICIKVLDSLLSKSESFDHGSIS